MGGSVSRSSSIVKGGSVFNLQRNLRSFLPCSASRILVLLALFVFTPGKSSLKTGAYSVTMSACMSVMPSSTNRKAGREGFRTIQANAKTHHVQRQMRKKYVGVLRRRRSVVWGIAVMRNFGFWLMAFASRLPRFTLYSFCCQYDLFCWVCQ